MEFPAGEHVGWCARASLRISRAVLACASEGRRTLLGRRIRELLSHQLRFVWAASRYQGGVQRGAWSYRWVCLFTVYIDAQCGFWVSHQAANLAKRGTLPLPLVLLHAPLSQLGK